MKKLIITILVASLAYNITAQKSRLVIYSQEEDKFRLELNGVLQCTEAGTDIMISELREQSYQLKVIFEQDIPELDKTIHFSNGISEDTYLLKKNRKGKYVLRFQNSLPAAQAPDPPASRLTYNLKADIEHISTSRHEGEYVLPGYDGYYGCPYPMEKDDFSLAKQSIESKGFTESSLSLTKDILSSNCLLTSQVCELIELFDFEDDKLEIAKLAYGSTLDVGNYFKVNDAFEFESSIEELDEYIRNFAH